MVVSAAEIMRRIEASGIPDEYDTEEHLDNPHAGGRSPKPETPPCTYCGNCGRVAYQRGICRRVYTRLMGWRTR